MFKDFKVTKLFDIMKCFYGIRMTAANFLDIFIKKLRQLQYFYLNLKRFARMCIKHKQH